MHRKVKGVVQAAQLKVSIMNLQLLEAPPDDLICSENNSYSLIWKPLPITGQLTYYLLYQGAGHPEYGVSNSSPSVL